MQASAVTRKHPGSNQCYDAKEKSLAPSHVLQLIEICSDV